MIADVLIFAFIVLCGATALFFANKNGSAKEREKQQDDIAKSNEEKLKLIKEINEAQNSINNTPLDKRSSLLQKIKASRSK